MKKSTKIKICLVVGSIASIATSILISNNAFQPYSSCLFIIGLGVFCAGLVAAIETMLDKWRDLYDGEKG